MPTGRATVTAKTGPAKQATSLALAGVTSFTVDIKRQLIQFYQGSELTGPTKEFDLTGVTTLTDTIASTNHTLVVS